MCHLLFGVFISFIDGDVMKSFVVEFLSLIVTVVMLAVFVQ